MLSRCCKCKLCVLRLQSPHEEEGKERKGMREGVVGWGRKGRS